MWAKALLAILIGASVLAGQASDPEGGVPTAQTVTFQSPGK